MTTTGVGVVGASVSGGWALQTHIPAIAGLSSLTLAAVATTRVATAEATAAKLGARRGYENAAQLATDPDVDLVTVAIKIPDHAVAVRSAIAARRDVYCEWPLAADTTTAVALRDEANSAGIRTVIGLQARTSPTLRYLNDLIREGTIGRVLSVAATSTGYANGGASVSPSREWTLDERNGLSALTVRAAHTLDAVRVCVDDFSAVAADVRVVTPAARIDGSRRLVARTSPDQVVMTGVLTNGASFTGRFLLGVRSSPEPLMVIHGEAGTIQVNGAGHEPQIQIAPLQLTLITPDGCRHLPVPPSYSHIPARLPTGAIEAIAELYFSYTEADDRWPTPTFDDAVRLHQLLDAIRESAMLGRQVTVDTTQTR